MAKSGWACLARRRHQRWWQADARSAERDGGYQHGDHGYQGFSEHTDTDRTTSQHNRIHRSPLGFIAITSAQFQTVPNYEEIRNPDYTEAAVFNGDVHEISLNFIRSIIARRVPFRRQIYQILPSLSQTAGDEEKAIQA